MRDICEPWLPKHGHDSMWLTGLILSLKAEALDDADLKAIAQPLDWQRLQKEWLVVRNRLFDCWELDYRNERRQSHESAIRIVARILNEIRAGGAVKWPDIELLVDVRHELDECGSAIHIYH